MWDKRKENSCMHKFFYGIWLEPCKIEIKGSVNSFYLTRLDAEKFPLLINGILIKI